jgi:hypothetical protein
MDLREIGSEGERWMELAQDCVQWRGFVFAVLNLSVVLSDICLTTLINTSRNNLESNLNKSLKMQFAAQATSKCVI